MISNEIVVAEYPARLLLIEIGGFDVPAVQALVELVAANFREVIATLVEEEVLEHRVRVVLGRGIARPQTAIELDERFLHVSWSVPSQGWSRCSDDPRWYRHP